MEHSMGTRWRWWLYDDADQCVLGGTFYSCGLWVAITEAATRATLLGPQ